MRHYKLFMMLILSVTFLFTGCDKGLDVTVHANDRYTVEIDGKIRTFYIKVPEDYDSNKSYALMFYLHGAGQTAFEVSNEGYTEIAHKSDYLVVYPGAVLGSWKLYESSDIDFIDKLINYMKQNYTIDKERVFVAGFSLGGFMAIKLAFEIPNKISAISVLSGSIFPEHLPQKQPPISVQHIHALDDGGILYNGTKGQVLSIPESIEYWKNTNSTNTSSSTIHNSSGIVKERWESDKTNCSVELITYELGGHTLLPGSQDSVIDFFNSVER